MAKKSRGEILKITVKSIVATITFIGTLSLILSLFYLIYDALGYELIQSKLKNRLVESSQEVDALQDRLWLSENLRIDEIESRTLNSLKRRQASMIELQHAISNYSEAQVEFGVSISIKNFQLVLYQAVLDVVPSHEWSERDISFLDERTNLVAPSIDDAASNLQVRQKELMSAFIAFSSQFSPKATQSVNEALLNFLDSSMEGQWIDSISYQAYGDPASDIGGIVRQFYEDQSSFDGRDLTAAMISFIEQHPASTAVIDTDELMAAIHIAGREAILGSDLLMFEGIVYHGPYESIPNSLRNPGLVLMFDNGGEEMYSYVAWEYTGDIFLLSQAMEKDGRLFLALPVSRESVLFRERLIDLAEDLSFGAELPM